MAAKVSEALMRLSLQGRFLLFLLLPVALISLVTVIYGFIYAREALIQQWIGKANANLENAARQIGCRLKEKLTIVSAIARAEAAPHGDVVRAFLVQRLLATKGVKFVAMDWIAGESSDSGAAAVRPGHGTFEARGPNDRAALPKGVEHLELRVNTLRDFLDIVSTYRVKGHHGFRRLTVVVDFSSLIEQIKKLELWKGSKALLVTSQGLCLAHTDPQWINRTLGESGHPLEKKILEEMRKRDSGTYFGEGRPPDLVMGFHRIPSTNWYVVLYSVGCDICGPMLKFRFLFTLGNVASLAVILGVIVLVTRSVVRSVRQIAHVAEKVEQGDYRVGLAEDRSDEIGQLERSFNKMTEGLRQRDLIQQTFGRYVDKNVATELMRSPEASALGGQEKTVTILMADLRGFTPIADKLQPSEVITLLNRYLSAMIPIIEARTGIIVDFYGDGILVFFDGTEQDVSNRAADAMQCAIEMQRGLGRLSNENRSMGLPELKMGIGIHTGTVIVGNVGSERRAKYGIVGSAVNFTQRVQSIAPGGTIIVSAQTHDKLADTIRVGQKFEVCFKGLEGSKDLFEVEYEDLTQRP
jgi:class 3 adenylate cyclase